MGFIENYRDDMIRKGEGPEVLKELYRKAYLLHDGVETILQGKDLTDKLPEGTVIKLLANNSGSDRMIVSVNGEDKEILSQPTEEDKEPVEALYLNIEGKGGTKLRVGTEFNRDNNPLPEDIKATVSISERNNDIPDSFL